MNLSDLYWFLGTFLVVYLFYFFFQVRKRLNKQKIPVELLFLIKKYNLDIDKIRYRSIMQKVALASSFDIAFTATFVMKYIKNLYIAILVGGALLLPLIFITYSFIGKYYVKKGLIKNGYKKN